MFEIDMGNMRTEAINSGVTGEKTFYSHAVTIFGIPIMYIALSILLILIVLYLFCRMKKKNCHRFSVMKKSSYTGCLKTTLDYTFGLKYRNIYFL